MILAAIERRWREQPDTRLGQLLVNAYRRRSEVEDPPNPLVAIEDGALLRMLGPETDEERQYISEEPAAAMRGWSEWEKQWRELHPPPPPEHKDRRPRETDQSSHAESSDPDAK